MDAETAQLDALKKERSQMAADSETLQKRLETLAPKSPIAKLSGVIRDMPLMGFINPSEKVQQIVVSDVLTEMPPLRVTTIDRCTTCHINIAKKDFTAEKVIAYLEEQAATVAEDATARQARDDRRSAARERSRARCSGDAGVLARVDAEAHPRNIGKQAGRIGTLARSVGKDKPITVNYSGKLSRSLNTTQSSRRFAGRKQAGPVLLAVIQELGNALA